jgi:hypothetical protein
VWPLLLLSTSETPESAGLGGREPATREQQTSEYTLFGETNTKKGDREKETKERNTGRKMKVIVELVTE